MVDFGHDRNIDDQNGIDHNLGSLKLKILAFHEKNDSEA
jgi:hypothetical protein